MLSTCMVGRDQQIDVTALINPATAAAAQAAFASPTRQLLGTTQTQWLQAGMAQSTATWQVLGQQVLMSRMEFPASILQALNPSNTSPEAQAAGQLAINAHLTAKGKRAAGAPLTAQESAATSTPGMATRRPVKPCWPAPFNCARSWWCWPEIPITAGTATSRSRA